MPTKIFSLLLGLCFCLGGVASADEDEIRKAIASKFPKAKLDSLTKLPYLGLYEVVIEGQVLYSDEKFDYIIDGSIIDARTMTNLSEERNRKRLAMPFDDLPLDLAFKKVKGKGERKVAVFSDPDCPFCKRIEQEFNKLDNVTIYVFLYPIESLHPAAVEKSKRIWCSSDKLKAWDDYMLRGVAPKASASCQNPIDKIAQFGQKRGITATPTMIFASGERVPGAISSTQIEDLLATPKASQ